MNGDEITRLVRDAQAGDDRAFDALVRAFQDISVAYATSIVGDYHLGEDVAQEAFLDAYRLLSTLREPLAFAAWFRTILFKHADRLLRKRTLPLTGLAAALDVASPHRSPADDLEAAETRHLLGAAIAKLSKGEQEVVLLYYMGDHSQHAIAGFLGVTPNTVKTRLHSARGHLRSHMSDIDRRLDAARPSNDPRFADKVRRLIQPEALKQRKPWMWSPGIGTDVWEMFCACIVGDLETVHRLVERAPSLVRAHYEYRTPLSFAVRENHLDVAAYLLDHGAAEVSLGDPVEMARDRGYAAMVTLLENKMRDLHGASAKGEPVAAAIRARDLSAVRRLLDAEPRLVHEGDARSNQPIHWAVMTRQIDMIDEVLARGGDINARRVDGARPIHLTNGDYHYRGWRDVPASVTATPDEVYRHLVTRGADVDLGMAAFTGDETRVRELLARDPSLANRVSDYGSYYVGCGAPLKNAAVGGHLEIVKLLLAHGADPNLAEEGIAPQGHALYSAVSNGHYEIAKLLLDHGAFPNPPVESSADAVWIAIRNGDKRMLALLGSYGAVMDIPIGLDGLTYKELVASGVRLPLKILAYYGDTRAAAAMLEANPALADDAEALENAAKQGHEDIARLLLQYKPELIKRVTVSKPRAMATLLFERGMDPNRPNWMRQTPLHHFARDGDVESAALYLEHGADIHAREEDQCSTPLAWAAMRGQTRMVEFLLRRGARTRLPDDPEWATPLAWATRRGHDDIVRLLEAYEKSGKLDPRPPEHFASLANDLAGAYAGDARALARVARHFRIERQLAWDKPPLNVQVTRLRKSVDERLERAGRARPRGASLARADAELLIATSEGFVDWDTLIASVTENR